MERGLGSECFRRGEYFEAHEAWERHWLELGPGAPRDRLKGWIQIAGIGVHLKKGQWSPVPRMAKRAYGLLDAGGHLSSDADARTLMRAIAQEIEGIPEHSRGESSRVALSAWLDRLARLVPPPEL